MPGSNASWRGRLVADMPDDLAQEIDVLETEIELRKQGKLDEKLFAETRLRRGVYGQRYDNGQRYDGHETRQLRYPFGELTKGPPPFGTRPACSASRSPLAGWPGRYG
jgi:sulfite reductase (ferredoxin)